MNLLEAVILGPLLTSGVLFLLIKTFLPAYIAEKGKNLATKEDIAEITHNVERVKIEYAAIIEGLKATNSLRMAAIDKRLQVHQEAFLHWRDLMNKIHTDEIGAAAISCQSWWDSNCLYLEPDVRSAFVDAHRAAFNHKSLLQDSFNSPEVNKNWDLIVSFPSTLFKAMSLPALSQSEYAALSLNNSIPKNIVKTAE